MRLLCVLASFAVASCVSDSSTVQLGAFGGRVEVCTVGTCGCPPGFTGAACEPCSAGFFKSGHGSGECEACPLNASSLPASSSVHECLCDAGFSGALGGLCTACEPGSYKGYHGPGPCTACPAGTSSPRGATELTSCECRAGFSGYSASGCTGCAAGKYKNESGNAPCALCPSDTFGEDTGNVAAASCLACRANSSTWSLAGQVGAESCLCSGRFSMLGGACVPCARGKHCPGRNEVLDCPSNSHGEEGLELAAECECNDGYYRNATRCLACAPDHWCAAQAMTPCRHDSSSAPLSTSADDCVCVGGTQLVA